jgi:DegT/DnrJ/EryC1/StrS aminotransferase family
MFAEGVGSLRALFGARRTCLNRDGDFVDLGPDYPKRITGLQLLLDVCTRGRKPAVPLDPGRGLQWEEWQALMEVEADTFNMDARVLERALENPGVRAIIPIHLFGACANMDLIMDTASRRGAIVIEDAAQAIGAEYKGRRAGSIGEFGCFSFFPSKNLGAYGDGGMITTNNAHAATKLKALRIHGRTGKYIHEWIGVNSRLGSGSI